MNQLPANTSAPQRAEAQPQPEPQPRPHRAPLGAEERDRAEANFIPYVAQALVGRGEFRVTADSLEMVELFQRVGRRVGDVLRRPVVSFANGEEIVITFDPEER